METTAAAIHNTMLEVLHRSPYKRSWTIKQATRDMRNGQWERRRQYYGKVQDNARLAEVDPWHLPPYFAMAKEPWNSSLPRTPSGYWKEKEFEATAIRASRGKGSSSPSLFLATVPWHASSPPYQGLRRTLEFYKHDGTKTDWVIHEYYQFNHAVEHNEIVLRLQEDVVFRKVFNKRQTDHQVPSDFRPLDAAEQSLRGDGDVMAKVLQDEVAKSLLPNGLKFFAFLEFISMYEAGQHEGCSDAGSGCGEFPTAAGVPCEEVDVWQHFTRINTKDPDVVYAACHRCDRVLKAHSKNGTSHLRRHREAKACSNSNPSSTAEDQEILCELRANLDLYEQGKEGGFDSPELNANLSKVDPWDLPPRHFTSSLSWETHQGRWKEVKNNDKLTAIRIGQLLVPYYVGLKRTLEFHHSNGTKMDWIMHEYYQVDKDMPPTLLLEGSMVFRKVFQIYEELSRMWHRDDDEEECNNGEREEEVKAFMDTLLHDCLLIEGVQGDKPQTGKRKRSGVWLYFTKIYTIDTDRVYAVCHCCDRCYKGHSKKDGTSHLKRHSKTCSSKRRKSEGAKQSCHVH